MEDVIYVKMEELEKEKEKLDPQTERIIKIASEGFILLCEIIKLLGKGK